MKVAIYARYSSENQREASIEDQFRICREFARKQGWTIAGEYSDHAISGATLMRPGFQAMMAEALRGKVDVVLAEALDRFSRDQEDTAGLFKRLTFAGVGIVTLAEGDITFLHIGLKGTMNAMFLKELADKTRRGLRGRVELGKSGGGVCFGYRIVRTFKDGVVSTGEREVVPEEADIIRRIFKDYIAGISPKQIAKDLNREGLRGPRGALWGSSTIYGNPKRGTGILHNELYIGRLVWNKLRYLKDPDSGKRVSRPNPESEWVISQVPALRIVDDELWQAVQARYAAVQKKWTTRRTRQALPPVRAPEVPVHRHDEVRRVRRGLRRLLPRSARLLRHARARHVHEHADDPASGGRGARAGGAAGEAAAPGLLRGVLPRVREGDEPAADGAAGQPERREARTGASEARHREGRSRPSRTGFAAPELKARVDRLQERKTALEAQLAAADEPPPLLHPSMADLYRSKVEELAAALQREDTRLEASESLRGLVESIVLTPRDGQLGIELKGNLAAMLTAAQNAKRSPETGDLCVPMKVVAGAGFEPATFGL